MAKHTLSFVSYAVNGQGVGHLVRQIAIHRWLRRYGAVCGVRTQHWFLTTSEADSLLFHEGFASFKLPSKSAVQEAGIDKLAYIALAKQWVWNSIALLRPDVMIVDTFPNGSFHELVAALDLCDKKALVYRPVRDELATRDDFRAVARLYDRVIVPSLLRDDAVTAAAALGLPGERTVPVGPLMRTERFERHERLTARERLGVDVPAGDTACVVVSGGGGGDDNVDALFDAALAARAELASTMTRAIHLVFAAGALYRGAPRRAPATTWWTSHDLAEHLGGVDAAICAAGFNTSHELAFAGVPAVLVPQAKIADDQGARADALVTRGAALRASLAARDLASALRAALDPARARSMADAGCAAVPRNCARDAAAAILSLVVDEREVRAAQQALDDDTLRRIGNERLPQVLELARALGTPTNVGRALDLLDSAERAGVAAPALLKTSSTVARKVRNAGGANVDDVMRELLADDATRGQWPALSLLLSALPGERLFSAEQWTSALRALLSSGASRGLDVFAVSRIVHECALEVGEVPSSQPIFALAQAKLDANATNGGGA